jgi:hypothetical protein
MRSLIIWSKNRPAQLELLTRSIYQNAKNTFEHISVIYKADNQLYQDAYEIVMECVSDMHLDMINQGSMSFEESTRLLITYEENQNLCFSTDDNLIYRSVPELPDVNYGECFSLRLGYNTVVQDHNKASLQPPLNQVIERDGQLEWNPDKYHPLSNYGYPWALDFHVYSTRQLQDTVKRFSFKNTNELESGLFKYRNEITTMKSFTHSCAVNWPLNCLSGYTQSDNISNEWLNEQFLNGKRLSLDYIASQRIIGAHQSFQLVWD